MANTQVTKAEPQPIAVLSRSVEEVVHALSVNFNQLQLSPFDFPRITIPTGGGVQWTLSALEGEKSEAEIQGVIVVAQDARTYFSRPFGSGEKGPPDCSSRDGLRGYGDPGGECIHCPLNVFGSKASSDNTASRGKACREGKQIFLMRGDELLPELLSLPPTSLKACRQYMLRLGGSGIPYYGAVTAVTLERTKNTGGIPYSEARFRFVRRLNEEETARALQFHEMCMALMDRMTPEVPEES